MSDREPRPRSYERVSLLRIDRVEFPEHAGQVHVTVTLTYEPWCCTNAHELTDAAVATAECLRVAADIALHERTRLAAAGREAPQFPYPAGEGWYVEMGIENQNLRARIVELEEQLLQSVSGMPAAGTSRRDGHPGACAVTARRWVHDERIPAYAEGYAAALMASRADLGLRDIVDICCGAIVPGYELPDELLAAGDA